MLETQSECANAPGHRSHEEQTGGQTVRHRRSELGSRDEGCTTAVDCAAWGAGPSSRDVCQKTRELQSLSTAAATRCVHTDPCAKLACGKVLEKISPRYETKCAVHSREKETPRKR